MQTMRSSETASCYSRYVLRRAFVIRPVCRSARECEKIGSRRENKALKHRFLSEQSDVPPSWKTSRRHCFVTSRPSSLIVRNFDFVPSRSFLKNVRDSRDTSPTKQRVISLRARRLLGFIRVLARDRNFRPFPRLVTKAREKIRESALNLHGAPDPRRVRAISKLLLTNFRHKATVSALTNPEAFADCPLRRDVIAKGQESEGGREKGGEKRKTIVLGKIAGRFEKRDR